MSFHGRWKIAIPTPIGRQEVVLDILHRDGVLSGTATQGPETVPFVDPVADGDRLTACGGPGRRRARPRAP